MALFDEGRVMIRVAANESQPKALNPRIPYTPEELGADAAACARAGASIMHFHSRFDDGAQALKDDAAGAGIYRRAFEAAARDSDMIMEPTNFPHGGDPSEAEDTPHHWALLDQPPAAGRLEIVNIDAFRFRPERTVWDPLDQRLYQRIDRKTRKDLPFELPPVIAESYRRGLTPFFGLFDLGDVRLLAAFARQGLLKTPVLWQINFFTDLVMGPYPSVAALDAFLAEWGEAADCEIAVYAHNLPSVEAHDALLLAALERGVHPRVGLGDSAKIFPHASNADVVARTAEMVARRGLRPISPAELRARAGVT